MPHYKSFFDRDYIYAFDLQGRDVLVTIDKVTAGELTGQGGRKTKKPLCYFRGKQKPLALNATNCKVLAALFGNDTTAWAGQSITLYPTTTSFGNDTVDCIRIRPSAPTGKPSATQQPEPSDNDGGGQP